jgi:LacI family transcriptional regulator
MSTTIEDVAAAAGVSRSTASRAMSGHPAVRASTRERVQAAAESLGYQVDSVARSLRAGSSGLIGLVLTNLMNASIQTAANTIQATGHLQGYEVLIATTNEDPDREREIVQRLRSHRVDGVIVMGTGANTLLLNELNASGFPVVALIRLPRGVTTPAVVYDDRDAARQACAHLIALGHRDIAFVGGPGSTRSGRERYAGFVQTLRAADVPVREELVWRGPFDSAFGSAVALGLLAGRRRATAVVVANHEAMSGVLQVFAQQSVVIPQELSIVGIEDAVIQQYWHPAITVIDTNPRQLGALALDEMVRQLKNAEPDVGHGPVVVPVALIERASTAPFTR